MPKRSQVEAGMPDRILRAAILTSESVNSLSWPAEVFYRRLMSVVDDFGRYDGRSSVLRAVLYPLRLDKVSEPDVVKWMGECSEAALVRGYVVSNKQYVEVQKFGQRLRAMSSKWPAPADICGQPLTSDNTCTHPSDSACVSSSVSQLGKGDARGKGGTVPIAESVNSYQPRIEVQTLPDLGEKTEELQMLVNHLMRRKNGVPWQNYEEERLLCEVARRPNSLAEFHEIQALFKRTDPKFVPRKMMSLLSGWGGHVDNARTPTGDPTKKTQDEKEIDRMHAQINRPEPLTEEQQAKADEVARADIAEKMTAMMRKRT